MENSRPDICRAKNHQSYLQDLFNYNKLRNRKFSHAFYAKKMSVAPSYLKNIFSLRRSLSIDLIAKVAPVFQLTPFETKFLTVMVVKDQVKEKNVNAYFDGVLGTLRAEAIQLKNEPVFQKTPDSEGPLRDPILHLLQSLVGLRDFRMDPKWIQACICNPNISETEIRAGYDHLLNAGFIEEKTGHYTVKKEYISSPDPYNLETFKIYRAGLKDVDHALDDILKYKNCGFLMSHLAVNIEDANRILEAFNQFRTLALEIAQNSRDPDRIIGISNNYLTLARTDEGSRN